jgi:integrase
MVLPPIVARSDVLYADLRRVTGDDRYRHFCLHLPVGSSDMAVGVAVGRAIESLRLVGQVQNPELRGLERKPGQTLADAISLYVDSRDYDTDEGERYARGICGRIGRDLGHMELAAFEGLPGDLIVLRWVETLRGHLGGHTVRNYLKQLFAVLKWAVESRLLPALPREPRRLQAEKGPVYVPTYEHWVEEDFRRLRGHFADEALRAGSFGSHYGSDRSVWEDVVAKRKLYLSLAYYTGMHTYDLNRVPAEWLSWEVGRYRRENHKSAACIRPASFTMPEQLQSDCSEEARRCERLGKPWHDKDLVAGGPWGSACEVLERARLRLWPEEIGRPPHFDFRVTRKSCAWEYCLRGWSAEQIAELLGHVDRKMVDTVYRRCDQLALISAERLPWRVGTAPRSAARTSRARVLPFR